MQGTNIRRVYRRTGKRCVMSRIYDGSRNEQLDISCRPHQTGSLNIEDWVLFTESGAGIPQKAHPPYGTLTTNWWTPRRSMHVRNFERWTFLAAQEKSRLWDGKQVCKIRAWLRSRKMQPTLAATPAIGSLWFYCDGHSFPLWQKKIRNNNDHSEKEIVLEGKLNF